MAGRYLAEDGAANRLGGDLDTTYDEAPFTGDFSSIGHFNISTGEIYGNRFRQFYNDWANREARTDLSWFVPAARGSHEIKAGLRYSQLDFGRNTCRNGSGRVCTAGDGGSAIVDIFDDSTGENLPFIMRTITARGREGVDGVEQSVYLQDSWRLRSDLTLHLGLRWDQSRQRHNFGGQEVEFGEFQPRLGVAWDVRGDGRNLLHASWGRYLNPTTLALGDFFLDEGTWQEEYWNSCSTRLDLTDPDECAEVANAKRKRQELGARRREGRTTMSSPEAPG